MALHELANVIARVLLRLKAEDVVVLRLEGISDLFDAFVVATGSSETHRRAMAEAAWAEYKEHSGYDGGHMEGVEAGGWILLDCGDVIAHILSPELRDYYQLEEFWGDAPRLEVVDRATEETAS